MSSPSTSNPNPSALHRPNLKESVADYLRDQILSGVLRPGSKISPGDVADELAVSRFPVREALIMLEAEGVVENIARRGAFVAQLTPEDFRDHYEMYGVLSGLAARRAAISGDGDLVQELEKYMEEFLSTDDPRRADELNFMFHQAVNRAGRSKRLTAVLRLLSKSMPTHFFEFHKGWEEQSAKEHQRIIDALKSRDGDAAFQVVYQHFISVGEEVVRRLESQGYWAESSND